MKTNKIAYNHDVDVAASPSSPCPTLCSNNPHKNDDASMINLPYEIITLMPSMSPPFTMKRPPYIGLEMPNHLTYSWDRLRILLL
jgi:hypothetical protein